MIIEDDPDLCLELKEGFSRWGFDAVMVKNFQEIFNEFVQNSPHLVIMDINLPYFDGFYWCQKIREVSPHSSTSTSILLGIALIEHKYLFSDAVILTD